MNRTEQNSIFRFLLATVSGEERGKKLLGFDPGLLEGTFDRAISGYMFPMVYLEFPLSGKPGLDLLVGYGKELCTEGVLPDAEAFGYKKALEFVASLETGREVGFGYEIDLSHGETAHAGVYLQHRRNLSVIKPFLEACGEEERLKFYEEEELRLGTKWGSDYIGFFPGRPGSPTRIGGYFRHNSDDIRDFFTCAGFTAWNTDTIKLINELIGVSSPLDYQLDILSDGTLSDVFGLAFAFNRDHNYRKGIEALRTGNGKVFMERLQELGLLDDRWKLIPDAMFTRAYPVKHDDGTESLMALAVFDYFIKIKFKAGMPVSVKSYLSMTAREL
ncbi:hypothetical protein UYO_2691 [Lachnospiraceae bacterium JC7]|nr:hypothetical protein UYO_2691 [Lachnospiraceae bacterium JC7]